MLQELQSGQLLFQVVIVAFDAVFESNAQWCAEYQTLVLLGCLARTNWALVAEYDWLDFLGLTGFRVEESFCALNDEFLGLRDGFLDRLHFFVEERLDLLERLRVELNLLFVVHVEVKRKAPARFDWQVLREIEFLDLFELLLQIFDYLLVVADDFFAKRKKLLHETAKPRLSFVDLWTPLVRCLGGLLVVCLRLLAFLPKLEFGQVFYQGRYSGLEHTLNRAVTQFGAISLLSGLIEAGVEIRFVSIEELIDAAECFFVGGRDC